MTTRRLLASAALAAALSLAALPTASFAADLTEPEVVGSSGYSPLYAVDGGVYGISGGSLWRIDGTSPELVTSGFTSVGQGVDFGGAFNLVSQDNLDPNFESNVVRVLADGTVSTTLDLNTGQFLGGVRALGATDSALFASTWQSGGGVVRTSADGLTWSTFTNPSFFPSTVTRLIGIGSLLYAQGSSTGPFQSGVFVWNNTEWVFVTTPGGITSIDRGDGRLLVGTSEGLYAVTGTTVTELDGDAVNPRHMAEFGGAVYYVDDSNVLTRVQDGTVTVPYPALGVPQSILATDTELYVTADGTTYRIGFAPGSGGSTPDQPELADTGSNDLVPLIAGIAIGIVVLGGALLIVRAVLARRTNKG
ncbi:hypothetical protein [Microcella sp.]|uniref:hypothetical protein n=1 Tax=Microcella sp. TaxID=1913979 RepID=UPI00256C30DD|nr:hypothetical protein [Microcella sp.]MBX9472212.1 hypothetical protein [Microcella sp.]